MKNFRKLLFVGFLFATQSLVAQDSNFYIFICFGQSNMEGQGNVEFQDKSVDSRFKVFQSLDCSNLGRTKDNWYTAVPPLCQCYSRLSPADYFGKTMVANLPDSISIGVINVSVAGCDIRLFDKYKYTDYDSTYVQSWYLDKVADYGWNPYQHLMDRALLAKNDGVIKGILLHQGESNTGQWAWLKHVDTIYNDMLTDLGMGADSVPLLAGEVLQEGSNCCSYMNVIIDKLPGTIPTAHVIPSDDCYGQDNAHFNSAGYRLLGKRYAQQMLDLLGYDIHNIEVECENLGGKWNVIEDANASNSGYIRGKEGFKHKSAAPTDSSHMIAVTVKVKSNDTYYLYGRFDNADNKQDAFWVGVDGNPFEYKDSLTTSGWEWLEFDSLNLTAGTHKIYLGIGEEGAKIDKLILKNVRIVPDDNFVFEDSTVCTTSILTGIEESDLEGYNLEQNYPNPTSGNTVIGFEIAERTFVSLKIYDSKGEELTELAGQKFNPGTHEIEYNTKDLAPGTYFYTIKAGKFSNTKRMVIINK